MAKTKSKLMNKILTKLGVMKQLEDIEEEQNKRLDTLDEIYKECETQGKRREDK